MTDAATTGTLVLVVGPSGAGKDTLLSMARGRLASDARFVFPRRVITRRSEIGEEHVAVDEGAFADARAHGAFALEWGAHGLRYGIPATIGEELAAGRTVAVNVSRSVVPQASQTFSRVEVCHVTAPPEVLAARLAQRGREGAADIAERLQRDGAAFPPGTSITEIVNDGRPEEAANRFLALLLKTQPAPVLARMA